MARRFLGASLALAFVLTVPYPSFAAPGDLDTTFDTDGKVTTLIGTTANARSIVLQPNGMVVVAGTAMVAGQERFAVARYDDTGVLDPGFDGDGTVTTPVGTSAEGFAVALQADGRIVVAGESDDQLALVRYEADGSLDTTFDGDGIVTTDVSGATDRAFGLAIQADGKIVAVGEAQGGGGNLDVTLVRYEDDGSLDTSFDGDGIVQTPLPGFGTQNDTGLRVVIDTSGRILVAGRSTTGVSYGEGVVVRYEDDGSLDTSFDGDGIRRVNLSGNPDALHALALQPDGKIVAAGVYGAPTNGNDFLVARLNDDGSADTSFDGDGFAITPLEVPGIDTASAVLIQSDGRIVVGGVADQAGTLDYGIVRYLGDGTVDGGFGAGGVVKTAFGGTLEFLADLTFSQSGNIVAAGFMFSGSFQIALARYERGPLGPLSTPTATATPTVTATPTPTVTPPCAAAPIAGCRTPAQAAKASFQATDKSPDGKDQVQWKWSKGAITSKADFGDPDVDTDYQLCVYDGAANIIYDAAIPAGGTCNAASPRDCWKEKPTGFQYKDADLTPDGAFQLNLKEGLTAGKASIQFKGKGSLLDDPIFGLAQPITVQLRNSDGICWEAVYSAPAQQNVGGPPVGKFKDKAD